jgi:hypothetical protein
MTTVRTTVTSSINPIQMSMEKLEAQIGEALQQAGKHLLVQGQPGCGNPGAGRSLRAAPKQATGTASADLYRVDPAVSLVGAGCVGTVLLPPPLIRFLVCSRDSASPWVTQLGFQSPRRAMIANQDG